MTEFTTAADGSLTLLAGIVDRPRATLAVVLANPRRKWLLPAILCLAATGLLLLVSAEGLSQQASRQQAAAMQAVQGQMEGMTEAQQAQLREQMALFSSPLFVGLTGLVASVVGMLIGWLLGAGLLTFGLTVGGEDIKFGALFAAFSWTWLPFALRDLVTAGWVLATGNVRSNPGLSFFVSTGDAMADASNPMWVLAGLADLFWLWHLILVYALIKAARPRGGALVLTLIYLLFYLAIRLVPALAATRLSIGL